MKQVLIIDESPLFKQYFRHILEEKGIKTIFVNNSREGMAKMKSTVPDLIILDIDTDRRGFMELLKNKKKDIHTEHTPVILLAQRIEQDMLNELVPYNIKKIFTKPIQINALVGAFSDVLGTRFNIDNSPSSIEAHVNENIVFIEVAKGLNRDKLELLRFKIKELMSIYLIRVPKVIIIFKDIKLESADTEKLSVLFSNILQSSNTKPENIKVLANDDFVREFINGKKEYQAIEVFTNLQFAMDSLQLWTGKNSEFAKNKAEISIDKMIDAEMKKAKEEMSLVFEDEVKSPEHRPAAAGKEHRPAAQAAAQAAAPVPDMKDNFQYEQAMSFVHNFQIAVVDDDFVIQGLIKTIFEKAGAIVTTFSDGSDFLLSIDTWDFDLIFLDINMPKVNGFEVLKAMQKRDIHYPVIVLSAVSQQETIVKAMQMGIKSYLVKPIKPEDIFKKTIGFLKTNF